MKYAKDTRPKGVANKAAEVLVEALPWIKNITGKTVASSTAARPWWTSSCAPT